MNQPVSKYLVAFGRQVAERREQLRLTQSQLAGLAGVTAVTISNIEAGKANPSLKTLNQIMDVLGLRLTITLS